MKKMILLVLALTMLFAAASAEGTSTTQITLETNPSTGYDWTAFILGGSSVSIDSVDYSYASQSEDGLDGAPGTVTYTLKAECPGNSLVAFRYGRPWEQLVEQEQLVFVRVDKQLNLTIEELSAATTVRGTVTELDEAERAVTVTGEEGIQTIVMIPEDMAMPVMDEQVLVYTDGLMTKSIPARVNAIAWETVPSGLAR